MNNRKELEKILNQVREKEHEDKATFIKEDLKSKNEILTEWYCRALMGEIFICDESTYESYVIDKKAELEKGIRNLCGSENFRDNGIYIRKKVYKSEAEDEIAIYYPVSDGGDLHSIDVDFVTGVSEFIDKVIYSEEKEGYKTFYRGHDDWKYMLEPGIYRRGREKFLEHEGEYIREIIASYPQYFSDCKSALDYLSVLQHNGHPTRLLDFSENPLVALFMACCDNAENHADVIKVSVPKENFKFYDSDTVSVLSNLALFDDEFELGFDENVKSFNKTKEARRLVNQIRSEKPYFAEKINPADLSKIVFVKAKQNFDRISHQNGLFALFGIERNKKTMPIFALMKPICDITHYIIPAGAKQKIIKELSQINITRASIYCDLENVSKYYRERTK